MRKVPGVGRKMFRGCARTPKIWCERPFFIWLSADEQHPRLGLFCVFPSTRSQGIVLNNNNRFLYSAFPNYDQSASQCIITPVIGFRHNSVLRVHFLHSLGSIPASRRFTGAHNANSTTIPFASYRVPIFTPGSRAAMWIKCLAEGQKYRAAVGFEPGLSAWESSGHTTIPRHPHLGPCLPPEPDTRSTLFQNPPSQSAPI